jgi:hypothetical protein
VQRRERVAYGYHNDVPPNPLSRRVVVLSWVIAAFVWPCVWWLIAAAQGAAVALVGGEWIGVAAPLGAAPWGLVNEPGVGFASSPTALYAYWLAPLLLPAIVALLVPLFLPGGGRWSGELILFHVAFASAALGLGLAPSLGRVDGPIAGLERFWAVSPTVAVTLAALAAAILVQLPVLRLSGALWSAPGGPLRRRRGAVAVLHGGMPALAWVGLVAAAGWRLAPADVAPFLAVLAAALLGALAWVPRAPRWRPRQPGWVGIAVGAVLAAAIATLAAWAGAPRGRAAAAFLWGPETTTSNVRAAMERVELRRHRVPTAQPGRSAGGS